LDRKGHRCPTKKSRREKHVKGKEKRGNTTKGEIWGRGGNTERDGKKGVKRKTTGGRLNGRVLCEKVVLLRKINKKTEKRQVRETNKKPNRWEKREIRGGYHKSRRSPR